MFSEALSLTKLVFNLLRSPFIAAARKTHIWYFWLRTRKPPWTGEKAKQIAYSVLAGDVTRAVAFRNIDSPHSFIACLRRSSEKDFDFRVYVLEQFGGAFRSIWKSDCLYCFTPTIFEVEDVDGDGNREVVYEDHSYGTGGGSQSLFIYSICSSRLLTVRESLNWQNRAGPSAPEIEFTPSDATNAITILEKVAKKHGFLQPTGDIDLDAPESSVERWHKENGSRTSGCINVHRYRGWPPCKASIVTTLDAGTILWISFFKGPLIGYERLNDEHFVAYSPAWSYNWVTCLAFDGTTLWFATHSTDGLMSYTPDEKRLYSYDSFQGTALPRVDQLRLDDGVLILNENLAIPTSLLETTQKITVRGSIN